VVDAEVAATISARLRSAIQSDKVAAVNRAALKPDYSTTSSRHLVGVNHVSRTWRPNKVSSDRSASEWQIRAKALRTTHHDPITRAKGSECEDITALCGDIASER
jgi:hypothetical protein